jgi:hypothetical protein
MQHIQGISRQQLQISSLEDKIALDNPVLPKRRDYRCLCEQLRASQNTIACKN